MNKIEAINSDIKLVTPKLQIGARDWNKAEKEALAHAYFEITKVSTGKGRVLDTGCASCIETAVNIVKNYCAAIGSPITSKVAKPAKFKEKMVVPNGTDTGSSDDGAADESEAGLLFAPTDKNWRRNHESIDAAAKELDYTFTESEVTKKDRITALEKHIKEIND